MNHFLCIKKKKIKILTFFYFFLAFGRLSSSEESQKMENFDFENINISFNGCGFLGIYHVGVACALNYYLPNMKYKNICGASAGAMAATCLISKVPLGKEKKIREINPLEKFREIVRICDKKIYAYLRNIS